ncbi:MAG: hypothetical protein PHF00_13045 [Elusimicrobia bacterium]|nr:hypothetical protein [Elusimicrobiota bacterium]
MSSKSASVVQTIDAFLTEVASARRKTAEANTEAGGYQGNSTHPSTQVEDRTDDAQEGSRSQENTSDVKDQEGAISVDSTSTSINQGQDEAQMNLGTQQSATGEDPSVETESAKGGKEDGGTRDGKTTHPARTDNDSLDGGKYATAQRVLQGIKEAQELGVRLVSRIANEAHGAVQAQAAKMACNASCGAKGGKPQTKEKEAPKPPFPDKAAETAAADTAGYTLASAVQLDKEAAEAALVADLAYTYQEARNAATKTAEFLDSFFRRLKEAEEAQEPPPEEDKERKEHSEPGGDEGGQPAAEGSKGGEGDGGGAIPQGVPGAENAAAEMSPAGGGDETALIQALLGGANSGMGGSGGGGEPGAGVIPPDTGSASAAIPAAPGAGPGLGGLDPQTLQLLEQVLAQTGITPEQLEAAATAKAAAALKSASVTPWRPKNAQEAQRFQEMRRYVLELVGNNR